MSDNIKIRRVWSIATGESLTEPEDFLVGESGKGNADKKKNQPEKVVGEEEVKEPVPSAPPQLPPQPSLRENDLGGGARNASGVPNMQNINANGAANMQNRNEDVERRQHMVMFHPCEPFRDLISIEWDNLLPISPHCFMPPPIYGMPASAEELERIVADYDREMMPIFNARSGHIFHHGPRDPVFAANGFYQGAPCRYRRNNVPMQPAQEPFAQNHEGFDFMQ